MANPQNVELEAAKFLHKLIQDSKDEPTKLATKLYVILQHMRSSGKENSMPYQVISRAMETVIKQHGLDIEALMSSRHPLAPSGAQLGESGSSQVLGSLQRTGISSEPKPNLAGNEVPKPDSYTLGISHAGPSGGGHDAANMTGGTSKLFGMTPGATSSYPPGETGVSVPTQLTNSSYENHAASSSMDPYGNKNMVGRTLDNEGGSNLLLNANKLNQVGMPSNVPETSMSRNVAPRDTGKAPAQAPVSGLLFKEHHLKQLRAQCLVFLAFRNGLMPKKLHLEIALGNFIPREEGVRREMSDPKGKEQSVQDLHNMPEVSRPPAGLDNARCVDKLPSGTSSGIYPEANRSPGADHTPSMKEDKSSVNIRNIPVSSREADSGTIQQQCLMTHPASFVSGSTKHMKPDVGSWPGNGCQIEAPMISAPASGLMLESQRKESSVSQSQSPADGNSFRYPPMDSNFPSLSSREQWKPIPGVDGYNVSQKPMKDSDMKAQKMLAGQETLMDDEDASAATPFPSSPKYTTLEKWILERQKRKFLTEKTWAIKHQKTEQRKIAVCSAKLKENVTSSEDINAKTKSVIELKKLKLLDLQRHLRSDIMSDFFKPIVSEMDRLKSIKKHRIGRKSKQLERYEQKMKEERQKRIRERQKEFFSEVEVHRERLEDVFKIKRERWKGFNRYVREFHKRKERIHREKIDRIQREKINLLKINDVEGYLRMVQDAKSDRVKQLLKETEKYLQKLGSKLQEAKNVARKFETDVDDGKSNYMLEKNEISFENEDETDQAKHYLESNEKYYMMAHSVKEIVLEQPTMLLGGKLREYQMNGLRWLVSLYNNHLNGILADEMGLGKTVQVISLLCYLMETKNDRGPFLVVVPSSVLPGWESEINFWAPSVQKIVYSGPPEERRRLFKEQIIQQKFNVLLTTYEYLMNKHDRPKLSKVHWHYIIIDEGHRIKNASCKLNADLKHYRSNHRLLLTGTPLQNNLEELWALLNFLLPNIFNSSEDFSQWFNKPFESNGDNSPDEALLSEEENLLIINRLHQVLRPFVLRRLKHKVENELPEKIERLIRCEASAYQKLLMKRVEENLGAIGTSKARSVHNSVMELRNICNHPYLSQLHVEEVHDFIPNHYLPNIVRLCGKLEMLDRLLPKLKATDHRVLLFSTMTRLLDVMEDYLCWKQYKYLRLDGHTSGGDRGALIDQFNRPGSPFFIFLLSIRAGGVGVNLQAADTVIIFDTDWNPQVDLQAQARAHRIGQKKDVLVLRLETVKTVEEQVRASAEHKLGVANQSITAGFFDNNTSAEDRREYLESLLRECKKEEAAPVLDDDALNDIIARSESEIDVFESVDKKRREDEMGAWMQLVKGSGSGDSECLPPLPSRLLMDDELKAFYEAMKISESSQQAVASNIGMKRKGDSLGGLDTKHYGRGKRAREVRSYEEQLTEEEFEKLCQVDSPDSPQAKDITEKKLSVVMSDTATLTSDAQQAQLPQLPSNPIVEPIAAQRRDITPSKRGRGRPRRTPATTEFSPSTGIQQLSSRAEQISAVPVEGNVPPSQVLPIPDMLPSSATDNTISATIQQTSVVASAVIQSASISPPLQPTTLTGSSMLGRGRGRGRKAHSGEVPRRRGKRQSAAVIAPPTPIGTSNINSDTTRGVVTSNSSVPVPLCSDAQGTTENSDSISRGTLLSSSTSGKTDFEPQQVQVLNQSTVPAPGASVSSEGPDPNQSNQPASDGSLKEIECRQVQVLNQSTGPAPGSLSGSLVSQVPVLNQSVQSSSGGYATIGASNFSIVPHSAPGSLVMAGVTQDPIASGTSYPNPVAGPSIVGLTQATTLADVAPKGRGRGRKAQSGVEAPRRRGKRQNPEPPAALEPASNQDLKLAELQEKKSMVNSGRRPTRRNKQEHDGINQSNVRSVASESITSSAITQLHDSGSDDKAGHLMNTILSDGSKNLIDAVVHSVFENKQENEAPTESTQTGASQGAVVVQVNKVSAEDEAPENLKPVQPDPSQDINRNPAVLICDSKSANEEPRHMNNFDSDCLRPNANSGALEKNKADRDNGNQNPEEFEQLDQSVVIKGSMLTKVGELREEAELVNLGQSDPSPSIATLSGEVHQEGLISEPTSCVESDASKSISELSRQQMEESKAERQVNDKILDALPSVVVVNKDLLQDNMDASTPQNKSDPPVGDVHLNQESEAHEETDVRVDISFEISDSFPTLKHENNRESDGEDINQRSEARDGTDARLDKSPEISEMVAEVTSATNQESDCKDVNQGNGTREESDVRLDMSIEEISEAAPEVNCVANSESDGQDVNQESGPHEEADDRLDMKTEISESVLEVKRAANQESNCQDVNLESETHEYDVRIDMSFEISESSPGLKHAANQEHNGQDVNEGSEPHEGNDVCLDISASVPEVKCTANQDSDYQDVNQGSETHKESDTCLGMCEISQSAPEVKCAANQESDGQDVDQGSEAQKEADVHVDTSAEISTAISEVKHAANHEIYGQYVNQEKEAQKEIDVQLDVSDGISELVLKIGHADIHETDVEVRGNVSGSVIPSNNVDSSVAELRGADEGIDAQEETDVQLRATSVNEHDAGSGDDALKIVISDTNKTEDALACVDQNVDQKNEAQGEHAQVGRTAVISASDVVVEHTYDKSKTESSHEAGDGFGVAKRSSEDTHLTWSTSQTTTSEILVGEINNDAMKGEPANKEPLPRAACVSVLSIEDAGSDLSSNFDVTPVEPAIMDVDIKGTTSADSIASKPQLCPDSLLEENADPALASVPSVTELLFIVGEPGNETKQEEEYMEGKDDALVSNPELINKGNEDDSVLPASSLPGISSLEKQSYEGEAFAPVSSFVAVVATVEDGTKVKDGSETSDLMNEVVGAPDSVKMAAEECGNNSAVSNQDSPPILCIDKNVSSTSDHASCKLEDLDELGKLDEIGNRDSGCREVPISIQSAVTESSQDILPPSLGTVQPVLQQSETASMTEHKAREDNADHHENVETSVESLFQKVGNTEVSSGEADAEDFKTENDLVSAHALAENQSLCERTSSPCSRGGAESSVPVSPGVEFQTGDDESTSKVVEKKTSSLLNMNVSHVAPEEGSAFQHCHDYATDRDSNVVSVPVATIESLMLEETTVSSAEINEAMPRPSNVENEVVLERSTVPNSEAAVECFKTLEETTVSNDEINEIRANAEVEKSENGSNVQLLEENAPVNVTREVSVSSVDIISSKDALPVPDMAESRNASGEDNMEKLESYEQTLEKESIGEIDATSNLILETVNRNMNIPSAGAAEDSSAHSAIDPNARVVVDRSDHRAIETADSNPSCAGNLLNTLNDSRSIGGGASPSLLIGSLNVTPAEALVPSDVMHKDSVEVQGDKDIECGKTGASDPEVHGAQGAASAGISQSRNGLQQLVDQYSDAADVDHSAFHSTAENEKEDLQQQ